MPPGQGTHYIVLIMREAERILRPRGGVDDGDSAPEPEADASREFGLGGIAFGCFGGRHRSVTLVERLAAVALKAGLPVEISHTALGETRQLSPSSPSSSA